VHELLSREDLDIISVKKIAESIVAATSQSVVAPGKHIRMHIEGPDILLPSSQATSVALILNELLQNAVEHGFGDGSDEGHIAIALAEDAHQVRLSVANDGTSLPDNFDFRKVDSLGLQIVDSLVRGDLQGKFTLSKEDDKTVAAISFGK
jgi:two-component sensor histidine kinase